VSQVAREAVAAHAGERGPLLPVLHAVAAELGCVPREAVPVIAEELNLSRADVHGVISFYTDFREAPPGRVVVKVCRAEACQAVGGQELLDGVRAAHGGRADVTVDEIFCLGNCALGPAVMVDERVHGRSTPARVSALIERALAEQPSQGQVRA
jgi:formate dehydrogenase subunit gamma